MSGTAAHTSYRCKQHLSPIHDFFISYRVAADEVIAKELFGEVTALQKHNGDAIKVYWDQRCLNDAANWQEGFLNGLKGSRVVILLISIGALSRMATASGNYQDNLLLEWEEALELSKTSAVSIFPIFIGTTQDVPAEVTYVDGAKETQTKSAYFPFSFAQAHPSKFPVIPHSASGKIIKETISSIFSLQGANYFPRTAHHLAKQLRELLHNLEEENANRIRNSILKFERLNLPGIYMAKLAVEGLALRNATFKKAVLQFSNFKNADLSSADFSDAMLQGVNFKGADITQINLNNSDCSGCWDSNVFRHTVIAKPIVRQATQLYRTNLSFANLANFADAPVNFERCTLSGSTISGKFLNTKFTFCEMSNTKFTNFEFGGEWRSKCDSGIFKLCKFYKGTAKEFTEYFYNCTFLDSEFTVLPARGFTNCKFERCRFYELHESLSRFEQCSFLSCSWDSTILYTTRETGVFRTNCELNNSKFTDCRFVDANFHTVSNCEFRGTTVWKNTNILVLEKVKIGLLPLLYLSSDNKSVSSQLKTMNFENENNTFRKIIGLRSNAVVWDKTSFPGKALLDDCVFKFNLVSQADDFLPQVAESRVVVKTGADGKIDTRLVEDAELNIEYVEQVWVGHKPSVVYVNCAEGGGLPDDNF